MRDSLDPSSSTDPGLAYLLQNVYPPDAERGTSVVGRPGFQQAGAQLGSAGVRTGQLVYQFTKLAGTEYTVAIVGGKFYTFDWGTRAWTEVLIAADFTTSAITLSATAKCYAVTMADKMIVSDGVNVPWAWDGTSNGGLTKLTNSPVLFGQPTVYYAKLFGIKNTERSTMVWSEENDPTTGYEAGGFNNAWELGQTDQEPLYALVGTNQALYYFRARSTGVISGAVNADFTTSGVHDGVSGVVGTQSPDATVYYEGRVYFPDADFRPHVIIPGSGAEPVWGDIRETIAGLDRAYAPQALGLYHPGLQLILFGVIPVGQTIPTLIIAIDPRQGSGQPVALFRGFSFQEWGIVKNASGQPLSMHLSNDGYAYDHGLPDGSLWDDALNAGTVAITHIVEPAPMGNDVSVEKRFSRADFNLRTESDLTDTTFNYETSRGLSAASSQTAPTVPGSFSRWDFAIWDTDLWSVASIDQHVAVGLNGFGRWIRPIVTHAMLGERFGLGVLRITAYPLNIDPSVP